MKRIENIYEVTKRLCGMIEPQGESNIDEVRFQNLQDTIEAPKFINERGFKITSYDGFEGSMVHGGFTWYQVRDSSNYLYTIAIGEWRGEIMLYNQTCLNAVKNSK